AIELQSAWFVVMGMFIALNCWNGWRAARNMMRLEKAPRHNEYHCPTCHAAPLRGQFWRCGKCAAAFDTFDTAAACPGCGARFGTTMCLECRTANPIFAWKDAPVLVPESR